MTHIQLSISERLNFFPKYKRPIIYTVTMLLVIVGQHYTMQMPLEPFRYIRQSVMSMLFFLCFSGAFLLMVRKSRGRADGLFLFLMFMVGLTNLISLTRGLTTGYASVVQYKYMSFSMLVYGSVYAYFFQLYPIEAFRPGWLTIRRALLLFLPTIVVLGAYLLATRIFHVTVPVIDDWSDLVGALGNITIWLRLFVLFYPVLGLMIMLRYRKNYREWCENNFASMENMDVKWLGDYIFGNFVITYSCLVIVFSNNFRSVLVHNFIFLFFFLYGFCRVFFQKNPYPEGYFRAGMNESKAKIMESVEDDITCLSGVEKGCLCGEAEKNCLCSEEETMKKCLFTSKLPEYRDKLEQWMQTEKPHLRKDFKLTDAMEILPLNRSYLSRLFNEGYGERFYHFVMRYRIAESKHLLLTRPDLTITSIADMSGFSSPSVFGRAFTQEMKCSPMQWRDKETSKNNHQK
ncbi:MAG: AraC family transcriptional regulator [Proteiniphilum sp.]|jgi:AraC-like DNA-binding protein|nr:AraC family transcriptional regulator [Proteiniphilum sp.]